MDSRQGQFEALVRGYASDLYRYAVWLGNTREAAEDLVQETFLRAWKSIDGLRDVRAARSWLMTILRREHARQFERPRAVDGGTEEFDPERLVGNLSNAGHAGAMALRQGLARLPKDYREPLVLQVLGGYSCTEIGELLGLKPGAVMTRLSRARHKLRRGLDASGNLARKAGSR